MINQIQWPGSVKPVDEPSCGFTNNKCQRVSTHDQSVVAAGTLGLLLFCATVITASIYRKWKIEQEIEGLLWKIQSAELHSHKKSDMASPASKVSTGFLCKTLQAAFGASKCNTPQEYYYYYFCNMGMKCVLYRRSSMRASKLGHGHSGRCEYAVRFYF